MKKLSERVLSVFLSLVIVLTAVIVYNPAACADEAKGTDIPLVYVVGQGNGLCVTENGKKREIYPLDIPTDDLMQAAKDNLDVFAKAVFTQEWEEFGDVLHDIIAPLFEELKLDENGEAPNGSRADWSYSVSKLKNKKPVNGKYSTRTFTFNYDWRLDPNKVADQLHQYIKDICQVTGYEKIALTGRCLGACIVAAYMNKYDGEYVQDLILHCSALNGATICSKAFSGDLYFDADSIERFMYDMELDADLEMDNVMNELLKSFVTLFNKTYGLDLTCWAINNVWEDIYHDVMPKTLIETMGTWPGFWSMVGDEDYIRAKENVFYGQDMEKWSNFIDIIDDYHYNVQVKAADNLRGYAERGIDVYNITKYGYQTVPISAPANVLSDSYCTVFDASMGATTTTLDSCFDTAYISNAQQNGTLKYISPDKQIDASTCLFPERTWFIKNVPHKEFPEDIDRLLDALVNNEDMTVDTVKEFPQYLVFEDDVMSPQTYENMDTTTVKYKHSFFDALRTFFENLFAIIRDYFAKNKTTE